MTLRTPADALKIYLSQDCVEMATFIDRISKMLVHPRFISIRKYVNTFEIHYYASPRFHKGYLSDPDFMALLDKFEQAVKELDNPETGEADGN